MTASLLANNVYDAQRPDDTKALVAEVKKALDGDGTFREEVEQHLLALQINLDALLQAVSAQRLSPADREWLVTTMPRELAHLSQPPVVDPHQEALREAYLNHLYEDVGQISFVGVDPQAAAEPNAPGSRAALGDIYVPLLTVELEQEQGQDKDGLARIRQLETDDPRAESRRLSAITQLDRHARLVVLGGPGSGKTTFARFVAQCLAGEALSRGMNLATLTTPAPGEGEEAKPDSWSHGGLLPAMVELRELAAVALPPTGEQARAGHLLDFLAKKLKENGLAEFFPPVGADPAVSRRAGGVRWAG